MFDMYVLANHRTNSNTFVIYVPSEISGKTPTSMETLAFELLKDTFCRIIDHRCNTEFVNMSVRASCAAIGKMHMPSVAGRDRQRGRTAVFMVMCAVGIGIEL